MRPQRMLYIPPVPRLNVVVPIYNEAHALPLVGPQLLAALVSRPEWTSRLLFVDDGSTDDSERWLYEAHQRDPTIQFLRLSRNFGKEAALLAGLDHLVDDLQDEDVVVVLDGDGQDPPTHIQALLNALGEHTADIAIAVRTQRASEPWIKRITSHAFHRLMHIAGDVPIPNGASDFCALRAKAVRAICQLRELHRFFKGITEWVGFRVVTVPYEQAPRLAGQTKWGARHRSSYALRGFLAHSKFPLRAVTLLGLAMATLAFVYGAFIVTRTMVYGDVVRGYPTLMVTLLALGGVQLLALGVIGEYLGRTLDEVRQRPIYIVAETSAGLRAKSAP